MNKSLANIYSRKSRMNFSISQSENLKQTLLNNFHPSQSKTMDEGLILVDENDTQISSTSKIDAHLKSKNNLYPHRAFSVFLFNKQRELLIQKRSSQKVTFPDLWSNSCCSHPLNTDEEKTIHQNLGIRRAAVRRMKIEFGIETKVEDYHPFEKILYRADSDTFFEEYELDYILLAQADFDLEYLKRVMNYDEVSDVRYISAEELMSTSDTGMKLTPWFQLIIRNRLQTIMENLNGKTEDNLRTIKFL